MSIASLKSKIKKLAEAVGIKTRRNMPCLIIHDVESRTMEQHEEFRAAKIREFYEKHPHLEGQPVPVVVSRLYYPGEQGHAGPMPGDDFN
jgi:hypothetical protein